MWLFGKKKSKDEEKAETSVQIRSEPQQTPSPIANVPSISAVTQDKKYVVRYEWKKCIGSAVCEAVAPAHFRVENGKAVLIGSKLIDVEGKIYEKEIFEQELDTNKMAADGCPPNCIHVINKETGEEIAPKK